MMLLLNRGNRPKRIGGRLMILIITFSSFLALVATAFQLFFEYREQRADMDVLLDEVGIFLPPLAASVWTFDDKQVALGLDALVRLPHIDRVVVSIPGGDRSWSAGEARSARSVTRDYPLVYVTHGSARTIATIAVTGSLDWIFDRVLSKAIAILVSNGIKTFLVAAFMIVVFQRLVTRRIEDLAARVVSLIPRMRLSASATPVGGFMPAEPRDEIEALGWAFDDMSDRLKLAVEDLTGSNAELRRTVDELSNSNALLERLTHAAAHDLREPVRNLVSFSQLLERRHGGQIGAEGREYLDFIVAEARRLSDLVGQLHDYISYDRKTLQLVDVDCAELVGKVVEELRPTIEEARGNIAVGPLPKVVGDNRQLKRMFHKLITNAVKYARPTVPPDIRVTAEREGNGWRFQVADNGIGIAAEYHEYVFELFRRLHTRASISGVGVGLAMCKRIAENHGGRIWLNSAPGEGTQVFFTIPDGRPENPA